MICLCCDSANLMGHVVLTFDMPLSKRGGGIKIGGTKFTSFDIRAAWEKLVQRPINCHDCGTQHLYDVKADELRLLEEVEAEAAANG